MYNFRNAGINPDTGLTYQEEYEASLQEENGGLFSNINWGLVGGIATGLVGTGLLAWNIFGGKNKETNVTYDSQTGTVRTEEDEILGMKRNDFFGLLGILIVAALITTIYIVKKRKR